VRKPKSAPNRFHGRVQHEDTRLCDHKGCVAAGEFRAPKSTSPEQDGYHWFCLDHVRAFNENWNYFDKASPEQGEKLANGLGGWDGPTWPFGVNDGIHPNARMNDVHGIFKDLKGFSKFRDDPHPVSGTPMDTKDLSALTTLGLDEKASTTDIRQQYKALVKRYHPDHTGGGRADEDKLRAVIEAYKHLMKDSGKNL
jgi:hypothetical protein